MVNKCYLRRGGKEAVEMELGKRGPKKGHGGRPRGSYDGPRKKNTELRRYWRAKQRKYRKKRRRKR